MTAHPGAVLACHDAKMEAHVVLDRVRQHSKAHGSALLRETLVREYYVHERARLAVASTKRWLSNELSFVEVSAPSGQYDSLLFEDVSKSDSTPSWRATVDEAPSSADLELAVPKLIASELESLPLAVVDDPSGRKSLVALRALKEGDIIFPGRCSVPGTWPNL